MLCCAVTPLFEALALMMQFSCILKCAGGTAASYPRRSALIQLYDDFFCIYYSLLCRAALRELDFIEYVRVIIYDGFVNRVYLSYDRYYYWCN